MGTLSRMVGKSGRWLKNNSSTLMAILGSAGVIGSVVTAITATPKALVMIRADSRKNHDGDPYAYTKAEAVKSGWKCYIPTAALCFSTIALIIGSNVISRRKQASLMSAYALLQRSYNSYKTKVKELYGDEAAQKVQDELIKDSYDVENRSDFEKKLFYDENSEEYFEATDVDILKAELDINYQMTSEGYITLKDYKDAIGIKTKPMDEEYGWSCDDLCEWYGTMWLPIHSHDVVLDDGLECCSIGTDLGPSKESLENFL